MSAYGGLLAKVNAARRAGDIVTMRQVYMAVTKASGVDFRAEHRSNVAQDVRTGWALIDAAYDATTELMSRVRDRLMLKTNTGRREAVVSHFGERRIEAVWEFDDSASELVFATALAKVGALP